MKTDARRTTDDLFGRPVGRPKSNPAPRKEQLRVNSKRYRRSKKIANPASPEM